MYAAELNMHFSPHIIPSDREIRFKCFLQNTILDVLRSRPGWQEVQGYVICHIF